MPSFSSLLTSLTGAGFFFEKSSRHATYVFNQGAQSLYNNQPRFPFEYYVAINLYQVDIPGIGDSATYISSFFNNPTYSQIAPLVKQVEMPSFKLETTPLNQYNRKRLSQTKMAFEPVKMVMHDVADGKTLKFWDMYYRYYFGDGNEPGKNEPVSASTNPNKSISLESFVKGIIPKVNPAIANLPTSVRNVFSGKAPASNASPNSKTGNKSALQNIVADKLDDHVFGYNLPQIKNIRNLIQSIDIFQVHGGRFNKVTLVNPRISAFTHDTLNYSVSDKTLELTFTFEYEYAYYTIQNLKLGEQSNTNGSSTEPFEHGEFLELPSLAFNAAINNFIESNNPLLKSDNPILQGIGKNVQSSIGTLTGSFISDKVVRRTTSSVLDGLAKISPTPYHQNNPPLIKTRPFNSTATRDSTMYRDVNRTGGNP